MNAHASTARAERAKPVHIGDHLREWRQRRHLSQLDLAGDAEISARHLSFVETGRAAPSREMVLKLAERLEVPLRERNVLLVAAGFAPAFPQRSLDDPALKSARQAIDLVLKAHEPNPALAYDRHWNLVSANRMVAPLLEGIPERLLGQPFNILRLAFHPEALAPRTVNLAEWCRASAGAAAPAMRGDGRPRIDQALSGSEEPIRSRRARRRSRPTMSRSPSSCGTMARC